MEVPARPFTPLHCPPLPTLIRPSAQSSGLQMADIPDVDLSKVGTTTFGSFEVEVVDYTTEYFATLKASGNELREAV